MTSQYSNSTKDLSTNSAQADLHKKESQADVLGKSIYHSLKDKGCDDCQIVRVSSQLIKLVKTSLANSQITND